MEYMIATIVYVIMLAVCVALLVAISIDEARIERRTRHDNGDALPDAA